MNSLISVRADMFLDIVKSKYYNRLMALFSILFTCPNNLTAHLLQVQSALTLLITDKMMRCVFLFFRWPLHIEIIMNM